MDNVLSKTDLVDEEKVEKILDVESASVLWQREEYNRSVEEESMNMNTMNSLDGKSNGQGKYLDGGLLSKADRQRIALRRRKQNRLTEAICSLLDDYSMVSFIPLNIMDEESIDHVLAHIDHTIQYGEDLEVRGADENDFEEEE